MSAKYDLSLFEERKKPARHSETDPAAHARDERRRKWQVFFDRSATVTLVAMIVLVFTFMLSSQAKLTELDSAISEQQEMLHKLEEEHKSLKNDLAAKTTASSVEQYATEVLHMQQADASQIEYVTVGEGDSGTATGEFGSGWLQNAAAVIANFFSQFAYLFS